jgi:hypothetical protein
MAEGVMQTLRDLGTRATKRMTNQHSFPPALLDGRYL